MRSALKIAAHVLATAVALPWLTSYHIKRLFIGANRALEGSSQSLSLIPGLPGVYLRGAFLTLVLDQFDSSAAVHFGTLFSQVGTRVGPRAYIGPRCHIGLADIGPNVLLAAGVQVPSGKKTHGTLRTDVPIVDQQGTLSMVRIGEGSWVGSSAVVLADIGCHSVVAAGAVVTAAVPDYVIAAGVPARAVRTRRPEEKPTHSRP